MHICLWPLQTQNDSEQKILNLLQNQWLEDEWRQEWRNQQHPVALKQQQIGALTMNESRSIWYVEFLCGNHLHMQWGRFTCRSLVGLAISLPLVKFKQKNHVYMHFWILLRKHEVKFCLYKMLCLLMSLLTKRDDEAVICIWNSSHHARRNIFLLEKFPKENVKN